MKKGWKIALISLASLLGLALAAVAVVLWLVFTPSQLTKIVNNLAGKYVLAETHFGQVDLTLFKTFPDVGLRVDSVYIVNPMDGAPSDTLARLGSLTVGVDARRFLKQKEVVVHQVVVDGLQADLFIDSLGQSNFDIFPKSDEDTASSAFSLDSLPQMDLRKVKLTGINASLTDVRDALTALLNGVELNLTGTLQKGLVDANLDLEGRNIALDKKDSTGNALLATALQELNVSLKGKGNLDNVDGLLKLRLKHATLNTGGTEMVNPVLQASSNDLLSLHVPFQANLQQMLVSLDESHLKVDDYALALGGSVQLATDSLPMAVDLNLHTDGQWQVAPLLALLPDQFSSFQKGMDLDAAVTLAATAQGILNDSTLPLVDAELQLSKGRFHMPSAVPYKLSNINGDLSAHLDMNQGGTSHAVVKQLNATTRATHLAISGRADDLLGDMRVDAALRANLPLEDAMPMVPDSLNLDASGKADIDLKAAFRLSDLAAMALERMRVAGSIALRNLDVTLDSLQASAPALEVALQLPAKAHDGKLADATVSGPSIMVQKGSLKATVDKPDIALGVNNPLKEQVNAAFNIKLGDAEAHIDSVMVSLEGLSANGSLRLDSLQKNVIKQYNPVVDVDLHGAVLYMPNLPDAVRLSQFGLAYNPKGLNLRGAEVKLGHSDFSLNGTVDNLEQWMDHNEMLKADLHFTSNYADIDQLINLVSGIGSNADTLEKQRAEDHVPPEANPFIVPKDVDVTLHTHIKRSVAFGNDLNDVAGAITVKDGVAILDQIGFVCKAATMQLTALYKSPRPNNLFVALDFHLLDIQIDELIDMVPTIDTLVPMLAAFNGNANFHLAAETFLDARYQPKMSSLLGSAAISGRNLTVLDNNSIAQIAKLMQMKSWKEKDNKIRIDSLDVEMTCFRKEIEVFPFLLNIGKYQICASGKHTLDNQCGYHVELLKNPLLAKVGVDIRGDLSKPKISLGEIRYADLYRPDKQGVVEKQTLELKRMIKEALEANVR